jgi:hypothetical protein
MVATPNDVSMVVVEEFVPVDSVGTMLAVAEALLTLAPQQSVTTAENLKRSMVWMVKYIAPTSEFWTWQHFEQPIDNETNLRVNFIGLGWVVGLVRRFTVHNQVNPLHVERQLCEIMDKITAGITVDAVARLKSTAWQHKQIYALAKYLRANGHQTTVSVSTATLTIDDITIVLGEQERVIIPHASSEVDQKVRKILTDIKRWANNGKRFEGADWCAYKRRRLTVVLRDVASGREHPTAGDLALTGESSGLYVRSSPTDYDLVDRQVTPGTSIRVASIVFPLYGYHTGVIHPRTVVRANKSADPAVIQELVRYTSYLWVNHYTRMWRYLDFEDQFAYASDVRRVRELDDHALVGFSQRALRIEELRSRIELLNRIDAGTISAYVPPHDSFSFTPGNAGAGSVVAQLRSTLIPSTITQLSADPLVRAPAILEDAAGELSRTHAIFVQTASLRMQRVLQVLQVLFIVAAVAQVLTLIPIADAIDTGLTGEIEHFRWYREFVAWKVGSGWLHGTDVSLLMIRTAALIAGSVIGFLLLRWSRVSAALKRIFE